MEDDYCGDGGVCGVKREERGGEGIVFLEPTHFIIPWLFISIYGGYHKWVQFAGGRQICP